MSEVEMEQEHWASNTMLVDDVRHPRVCGGDARPGLLGSQPTAVDSTPTVVSAFEVCGSSVGSQMTVGGIDNTPALLPPDINARSHWCLVERRDN